MKIATWNVNSIRIRLEQLINLLHSQNIDVILLQEIKCQTEAFPYQYIEDIGYNYAVFGQKTFNGVAILSKYLIEDIVTGDQIFKNDNQSRYIEAFINGYKIGCVYVPNGQTTDSLAYQYKLNFLEILKNHLYNISKNDQVIIGGDFNIARNDLDVYNPKLWKDKVCCTKKERDLFDDILKIGFNDFHREINNNNDNNQIYTWWDYRNKSFIKNNGLRIDYILTTNNIKVKNCYVDLETRSLDRPSDHAPIIMDIL